MKVSKITANFSPTRNLKKKNIPKITVITKAITTASIVKSARNSTKLVSNYIPPS